MAYSVKMEELNDKGKEFCEFTNTEIRAKIDDLANLIKNTKWEGVAKDTFDSIYTKKINDLYSLSDMLERFGYYMRFVAEKYNEVNVNANEEFQKYLEQMREEELLNKNIEEETEV